MGRVCVGRLCYGPSLQWAEFAMLTGRFGPIHVRISGRFGPIPFGQVVSAWVVSARL